MLSQEQRLRQAGRKRRLALALLLIVGVGALALYAYDRSRSGQVAAGARVGGVEIGGLDVEQARVKVARLLLPRYQRPLVIVRGGKRFVLTATEARLRVGIAEAVASARTRSRRGGFLDRVSRELVGRPLGIDLMPRVRYSQAAVAGFVRRVQRAVAVQPRAARFVPSLTHPRLVSSRNGLAVRGGLLGAALRARLSDPASPRLLALPSRVLVPRLTTATLQRRYRLFITVSRGERRLRLFERLRLAKVYVIAVGRIGLETPAGLYQIDEKEIDPAWHVPRSPWAGALAGRVIPPGPDDPLKARWLGFYDGAGIHGTDVLSSLGTAASHGCIRMSIPDVIELYKIVPLHTPVFIS